MEFKGEEGLQMLLAKGLDFGLWDQEFADSRCVWGGLEGVVHGGVQGSGGADGCRSLRATGVCGG